MNQRFQNAEINWVNSRYADNGLYASILTIGMQLEAELQGFGLCPEECFVEAADILSFIADEGENVLPDVERLWLRKYNEYRRLDRNVSEDETRKVTGIIFGFVILALDSSSHPFYRYTLTQKITETIAAHDFDGWVTTLSRIFSVHLPDGWFDGFVNGTDCPVSPHDEADSHNMADRVNDAKTVINNYINVGNGGQYQPQFGKGSTNIQNNKANG